MQLLFSTHPSYTEDETDPSLCDPFNVEDYSYSVLSKLLVRPVKPAGLAKPVTAVEGSASSAGATQVEGRVGRGARGVREDESER